MPSLVIITVWNWLGNLNPWHEFGPYTEGMGPYTFLMMISVYSLGRIIRIKSDRAGGITGVRTSKIAVASIVNLIILVCGWRLKLGMYCSPFAMSMAVLMFFLFKKVVVSPRLESLVLFIAPSMFSIYLLHAHIVGDVCIKRVQHIFVENGVSPCLFIPLTAVIVFVICFAIDLPRRSLMCRIKKKLFTVLDCHDKKFESVITRLVNGQSIG